jgi:ATP-binding cassette subfamily B protein
MKTILRFLKPYTPQITIAYIFTFIELMADLLFPLFLGIMINEGITQKQPERIFLWGGIMLGITVISFSAGIGNSFFSSHISNATSYDIRKKLFATIQRFSFDILHMYPTSMIVTRFTNDVRQIQNTIFMSLRIMVRAPLMVIGSIIMAFIINVKISLIFLFTVPLLIVFLYWVLIKGSAMFSKIQGLIDNVNRVIQENIAGMRIIKAFVRRDFENQRFERSNRTLATQMQTAFRFIEASMPILLFVMNLSLIFILWYGNKQAIAGTTSVGDVVAIVNYALRTVMTISMFTFIALAFSRAKASGERIHSLLSEKVTVASKNISTCEAPAGKITFKDVTFSYPNNNVDILSELNFTIEKGETLAIIGATGSGKTTLFQLIPRLYEPTSGEILFDDIQGATFDTEKLRNSIGYVSQNPLLFTGSIAENIRFGKENATTEEVIRATKAAQIHDTINHFPNQYESIVGQKGVNLSGGQKQRISIARALIREPKILMLDDSTSALDMTTERKLLKAIQGYHTTTLIITQKVTTAQQADRILLLDAGKILALGTHASLLESSTLYQEIVTSQEEKQTSTA